eukprot:1975250-Rhodomonas_salina.1
MHMTSSQRGIASIVEHVGGDAVRVHVWSILHACRVRSAWRLQYDRYTVIDAPVVEHSAGVHHEDVVHEAQPQRPSQATPPLHEHTECALY